MNLSLWQSDAEIIKVLGQRIRERRLTNNLTQAELAKETGLSTLTLQKIESGQGSRLESFVRILRFFGELDRLDQILKTENLSPQELYKLKSKKPKMRIRK